jgi:hypothetical protein
MTTMSASITPLLGPQFRDVYMEIGEAFRLEYPMIMNVLDMEWNPITDKQISGLGTMPEKPESTQFTTDEVILGGTKSYEAVPYGLAVEISFESWKDELYGTLEEMVKCISRAGKHREEVAAWSAINNAFSTSYNGFTASEALCSTSHTGLDGETRANRPSPDIGFGVTFLQNGILAFEGQTDERNFPIRTAPSVCLISPKNRFTAREIFGSAGAPYTTDNEINALPEEDMTYMVYHYGTAPDASFLLSTKDKHDLKFFWRNRPDSHMFDDPWTKNAIFTGYQRHTIGAFGSWRNIYGSTG